MFKTMRNAWGLPDLRKKLFFTLFIIVIFRIGSMIPVPFLNAEALKGLMNTVAGSGSALGYLDMLSGGAFASATLFAMSITPYINASIIMQLLTVAIPPLERLSREGELGRKKVTAITRYLTVALGLLQGTGYYFYLRASNYESTNIVKYTSGGAQVFSAIVIILSFTAGTALLMWLGERINKRGVGNGISILLFAGIVANMPTLVTHLVNYFTQAVKYPGVDWKYFILAPVSLLIFLGLLWVISFMNDAERRIPIQYAKRVVGRKMYQGQSTHIPIKVGVSGVMPVIFASSILSIPSTIQIFLGDSVKEGFWKGFFDAFTTGGWIYCIIFAILIILFAFFYVTIQYNPIEMANNLRQNNGSIPGVRPGKATSDYIAKILSKITLIGALFLAVVTLIPMIFTSASGMTNLTMGGTSIIILVGVALETIKQMESQMQMRNYKGFLD